MKHQIFNPLVSLCALATCQISIASSGHEMENAGRPNVIIVITDDQGYGDMSCHGHPFLKTPNMDRLFNESVRLDNFHVSPNCAPTRAALLTGKYPARVGVWHTLQGRYLVNKNEITLAQVFEENGYNTSLIGKWHLGDNYPYRPQDRGFQEVLYHGGGGIGQNPDFWRNTYFSDVFIRNGEYEFHEGYCTDTWFDNAISYIQKHKSEKSGKPFFLQLATNAPHYPYFVEERYAAPFREMGMDDSQARFLGMNVNLDENLGRLLKEVDNLELSENTIFIFMGDNGSSGRDLPRSGPFFYNAGMRGLKASKYDGGHRVFSFIRWPQGGLTGGRKVSKLTAHIDLMPTLIELCNLSTRHVIDFDGKSIVPLLKGESTEWKERTLFVQNQRVETPVKWRNSAVMTEQYRLIDGIELYDIINDPGQQRDISKSNPEIVKNLRSEYDLWWDHISESFDTYNRLYLGHEKENPIRITCHDWFSDDLLSVYDQEAIRQREHENGFWAVDVVRDGEYKFTCRTFPVEEDTRLDVVKVRLKIGDQEIEKEVNPGSSEVSFKLNLPKGEAFMQTWFYEKDGNSFGVPFLYIERL